MMNRFRTVLSALFLSSAFALAAPSRPNILFILADDLGYMDVNAYAERVTGVPASRQFYETPNIDRLIREGTAFSQAYACQLCSPTRAGVLTGRNAAKIGVTTATPGTVRTFYNQGITPPHGYVAADAIYWGDNISIEQALLNGSTLEGLPSGQPLDQGRDEITLAEALTGYRSAFIGKWHLGGHGARGWQPPDQGFAALAYSDEGGSPYFNWRRSWDNRKKRFPKMPQPELLAGKTDPATDEEYLTDALTDTAVRFIQEQAGAPEKDPFFLYFCHFAVHTPLQAKQADIDHFKAKSTLGWNGHRNATYAGMVKALDDSVGRLLDALHRTGLESNTLVVFMSDNGGVTYTKPPATSNAPLKGGKAMHFEGGIRVPLAFRWPERIPANQWCAVPVTYEDVFPTLLELAGFDPAAHYARIDGRSLAGLLRDPTNRQGSYRRNTFYWHYPFNVIVRNPDDNQPLAPHSTIREGDWKLVFDWSGVLKLYNMARDPFEKHNLSAEMPDKTQSLFLKLNDWLDANVATKYLPALNPDYDATKEARARPFVDLRRRYLGDDRAIRNAAEDPRFEVLKQIQDTRK